MAILILALVLAVPLAGCNSQPPGVTGDVTLDGQPLADGVITYVPVDQKTPNVEVKIQDGKYTPASRSAVTRSGSTRPSRRRGKDASSTTRPAPPPEAYSERIPERYNAKTELTADIKPGDNKLDWEVKSK